jgi:hypothetical protein
MVFLPGQAVVFNSPLFSKKILTSDSYSLHQPDNQKDDSYNEQDIQQRTCDEIEKESQQPQYQQNNGNDHQQIEHFNLLLYYRPPKTCKCRKSVQARATTLPCTILFT